jgi:hypothetical protein
MEESKTAIAVDDIPAIPGTKFNRRERRAIGRRGSSVAKYRSLTPKRTGQPAWFGELQRAARLRYALSRIKVASLSPEIGPVALKLGEKFKTVLELSRASQRAVLATETVGPAAARRVHAYLAERGVEVSWKAP